MLRQYMIGSVIVWVATLIGSAVILAGTPYFGQMIPILGGAMVWSIILAPGAFLRTR